MHRSSMVYRVRESLRSNCDDSRQRETRTRNEPHIPQTVNPPQAQKASAFSSGSKKLPPRRCPTLNNPTACHHLQTRSTDLRQHTFDAQTAEQENEEGNVKLTSPELELVQQLFGVIYDSGQGQLLQVGMRAERGYAEHLRDACGKLEEQQRSLEI